MTNLVFWSPGLNEIKTEDAYEESATTWPATSKGNVVQITIIAGIYQIISIYCIIGIICRQ